MLLARRDHLLDMFHRTLVSDVDPSLTSLGA